jgi:uncharacterized protein YjcR
VIDLPLLSISETIPTAVKRHRGAPFGNTNALKHGFYSRSFRDIDCHDLEQVHFQGLEDEITMLRVFIRRVTEISRSITTFTEGVSLLRVLSLASISLTRLLTTQKVICARSGRVEPETNVVEAIQNLIGDLPLFQNPDP